MTSPLSPEAVAQMVADREAGTPGPWRMRVNKRDDQDTCDVSICGDIFVLADLNGPQYAHQHANASRIARLPDLEAAYLTLAAELATLRASEAAALERVKVLEEALADPIAVHANMLRGAISMPTVDQIIHLYGIGVLCEALAPMIVREASDPTDYERKVAQMKKDFPNGI